MRRRSGRFYGCICSFRTRRARRRATACLLLGVLCALCCTAAAKVGRLPPACLADTQRRPRALLVQGETPQLPPYPLQTAPPYTVALDAGHGGYDPGAQAGLDEADVCKTTVEALFALLDADENFTPVRTRADASTLSPRNRADAANLAQASLLISVHANSDKGNGQSHGFECFPTPPGRLYADQSMRAAQAITQSMQAAGHRLRGENGIRFAYYSGHSKKLVESGDTKVRSQKSFGVLENAHCPAVLVEQCFLTNRADVERWATPEGCANAAQIYYTAICTYFGTTAISTDGAA